MYHTDFAMVSIGWDGRLETLSPEVVGTEECGLDCQLFQFLNELEKTAGSRRHI